MSFKHNSIRMILRTFQGSLGLLTRKFRLNHGVTVFLFHSVTDQPSEYLRTTGMWTTNSNFKKQIKWIMRNFEIIPITRLLSPKSIPENSAIITFDDAWLGSYEAISEILIPDNIPVCYFINFGSIIDRVDCNAATQYAQRDLETYPSSSDVSESAENWLIYSRDIDFADFQGPLMSYEQLSELSENHLITLGNHLYHHHDSNRISDEFFTNQLLLNQRLIDQFGSKKKFFAFPFGAASLNFEDRHLSILMKENFDLVFSTDSRRLPEFKVVPSHIPRIHFSPLDCSKSDFWWATFKNQLFR